MKKLHISTKLSLPADTVTASLVVYGAKGMGKTNLGAVIVEELTKCGLRWCYADPLGVVWGLRHSKDGRGPGIECLILGGAHGDIPIEPTGGAVVADLVVDEPVNVIIDFSRKPSGEMWGIGEKTRFITDYAKRLFQRQGELVRGRRREPICQILDEAARYIPQMIPHGNPDLAKCVSAWETLTEEGRNVGLGVIFLTQRSARMNKSVSEVADAMIAFRTVGPNSIGAVTDWLGEHVEKKKIHEYIEQVRSLDRGTCLVVSPGWLRFEGIVPIRERETFDSSATPRAGQRPRRVTGKGAKPDLAKYATRMKETIERARDNDPASLRQKIAELQRELKKPEIRGKSPVASVRDAVDFKLQLQKAFEPLEREYAKNLKAMQDRHAVLVKQGKAIAFEFAELGGKLARLFNKAAPGMAAGDVRPSLRPLFKEQTKGIRIHESSPPVAQIPQGVYRVRGYIDAVPQDGKLPSGEAAVLKAVAQYDEAQRDQLSVLTGYKKSSRDAYLSRLVAKGYVTASKTGVTATQAGIDALGKDYQPLPTGNELRRYWLDRLPEGERKILEVLIEHYPRAVHREHLDSAGYKKSSRDAYLSRLGARRLVEVVGRSEVRAVAQLFE